MIDSPERLDRLYELLPAIVRMRDHDRGEPLRALLQVISEQVNVVEDDIAGLYENWFIETCDDWVVPYLADLVGWTPIHEAGEPGHTISARSLARNKVLIPRREVANTIRYRRRKGTLALLELLARDVAGWPARAVEFRHLLARTASLEHVQARRGRMAAVRRSAALDVLGGPFETMAHLVDVRRIHSRRSAGRHNLPSVGVFVWRLGAYSITDAPADCIEEIGAHCYTFSALGHDTPLFTRPRVEPDPTVIDGELNVPGPIRRRAFADPVGAPGALPPRASEDYYGLVQEPGSRVGQSVAIWAEDWPRRGTNPGQPIPRMQIIPADLSDWSYVPPADQVAVDPVLGRFVFPRHQLPRKGVRVSYHYGFSADMGGGEYERTLSQPDGAVVIRVTTQDELRAALQPWRGERDHEGEWVARADQPRDAVIEIATSGAYVLPIHIRLAKDHTLQIRAAQRTRPVLRMLDYQTDRPDNLQVAGDDGSHFTLDGVVVAGRGVHVSGALASFTVRHSTLVPGWALHCDCEPRRPAEPSIEVADSDACLVIDHSIVGSIQIHERDTRKDPITMRIRDSIVDATHADCDGPRCEAIGAPGSSLAHAVLTIARATVIGRTMVHAIERAEDSIFVGRVTVARRQVGCMRFCYVKDGSRTPRRFHCQPDLALAAVTSALRAEAERRGELAPLPDAIEAAEHREELRVRPRFESMRYGRPTYGQLALDAVDEIAQGAEDGAEMGAFHDLFQPQRMANLLVRLDEYVPAAADVGVIRIT